ncbi:hypothetical protein ACHHYP_15581 [Achlya hypogyna]|uniref:COMM domain-containing protein n=1 Tax=Achlya hypogyna TaxID=1202772 RepID=A0A1V9YAM8_ACHHY|nr:hypothetical protein ACHHYP_15581 [Achlya hypogyna]
MGFHQGLLDDAAGLAQLTPQQLEELCGMLPLLTPPATSEKKLKRKLTRHASQYGWSPEAMDKATASLSVMLTEAAKRGISSQELAASVAELQLTPESLHVLTSYYERHCDAIKTATAWHPPLGVPSYHGLSWRLDMELGTRLLHNRMSPELTLSFETRSHSGAVEAHTMQTEFAILKRLHESLKAALKEAQSPHCSRMQRYLQ